MTYHTISRETREGKLGSRNPKRNGISALMAAVFPPGGCANPLQDEADGLKKQKTYGFLRRVLRVLCGCQALLQRIGGAVAAVQLRAAVAKKIVAGAGIAALAMSAAACANPLEDELNDLKAENDQLKETNTKLDKDLKTAQDATKATDAKLKEAEDKLAAAKTPADVAAAEAAVALAKDQQYQAQLDELNAEIATLAPYKEFNGAIEWINSDQRKMRAVGTAESTAVPMSDSPTSERAIKTIMNKNAVEKFNADKTLTKDQIINAIKSDFTSTPYDGLIISKVKTASMVRGA